LTEGVGVDGDVDARFSGVDDANRVSELFGVSPVDGEATGLSTLRGILGHAGAFISIKIKL